MIESDEFFEGRYKGKVIQVHSNIRGEEKDEVVQQLLTVEHPDNPVEIVIHVNMLKEGWDVTNLYTIVPLRAANSRTWSSSPSGAVCACPTASGWACRRWTG